MIAWLWMVGMMFVILVFMLGVGLCQAAAKPAPKPQTCTRLVYAYHVDSTGEERPTRPNEVEPELEMERRTR
jgi:hypothetical protein